MLIFMKFHFSGIAIMPNYNAHQKILKLFSYTVFKKDQSFAYTQNSPHPWNVITPLMLPVLPSP